MPGTLKADERLLRRAYDAFNGREIEAVLSLMDAGVEWPNGMEGGHMRGREAVREYWLRQWQLITPTVTPVAFHQQADGRILVDVRQVVRDLSGEIIADQTVGHMYSLKRGLISHMEIVPGLA
jgi:hypothetical protein